MVWPIIRRCVAFGSLHLTDAASASQRMIGVIRIETTVIGHGPVATRREAFTNSAQNESAPDSMSQGRSFEQPSPRSLLKDRLGWFVKIVNSTCVLARK